MSRVLTYVEIDTPQWTQTSPGDSPATETTYRFAVDTDYLPNSIPCIPSITDISIQPATVSLGQNLGQRASVEITLRDHRHIFDGEEFESGTFWGKFRARYGQTLQGNPFRLIHGILGQSLDEMEMRHYFIDRTDGPTNDGQYKIIAKDIFTLAQGERVQAPTLSSEVLANNLSAGDVFLGQIPSSLPANGYLNIGGTEIVAYTYPSLGNTALVRAQFNTTAVAHEAGERLQYCLVYEDQDVADIINDLLVNYALIDSDFIPLMDWQLETEAYLNVTYSAVITEPKPVDQLLSELIEQAALILWWDEVSQAIRLQVLRAIPTNSALYDETVTLAGTLEVTEQPERRIDSVIIYYGKFNPLIADDQENNYSASVLASSLGLGTTTYAGTAIKKIHSRWIAVDTPLTAEILANKLLGRFADPPRSIKFSLMRDQPVDPQLGGGYRLSGIPFQTTTGETDPIPIQVTRLNPMPDRFEIEAEEMLWQPFGDDVDPAERTISFGINDNNVNLRDIHDEVYSEAHYLPISSGDIVNAIIQSGVIIGSLTAGGGIAPPSFDIGDWPAGVTINLIINGRIEGGGGAGGGGGDALPTPVAGQAGQAGGTALYTRYAINLTSTDGQIWGGGGGGGGNGATDVGGGNTVGGNGGGGGAGNVAGDGGAPGQGTITTGSPGNSGQLEAGGNPNGGDPGQAGTAGISSTSAGGAGGAAGIAIDGDSFVTDIGAVGDIRGSQVN